MSERVPAWAESDERYPEREAEWRAAIARAERAEAGLSRAIDVTNERDGLRLDLAAAIARAERAEGLCAEAMYALGQQGRPADLMPMAVRAVVSRADAAEVRAERAEAGLAALREASRSVVHVAVVPYSDKGNALLQAFDKVIADTAAAAEAYRARIAEETAAPWKAALDAARRELQRTLDERDTLAAALAEVREIHAALVANDALPREAWSEAADAKHADLSERLDAAMAALPADLAADAFRRVRAEALEAAAGTFDRVVADNQVLGRIDVPHRPTARRVADAWMFAAQRLRARAADERGGR